MLVAATAARSHTFAYDPLMRLYYFTQSGFGPRTYIYDGHDVERRFCVRHIHERIGGRGAHGLNRLVSRRASIAHDAKRNVSSGGTRTSTCSRSGNSATCN